MRFTEDGQTLELGDGRWGAFEAAEGYRLSAVDPKAGDVAAFVTVQVAERMDRRDKPGDDK